MPLVSGTRRVAGLRVHEVASPARPGLTVVGIHGLGVSTRHLRPILEALAPHRRVVALDLPGFGRSERPPRALGVETLATVVRAAREANAGMPAYTVGLLEGAHGDLGGARVAVLGASYRGGVKETAFSGVFSVVEALRGCGAITLVHDPLYTDVELRALGFEPYHLGEPVDAAVLQADHREYVELAPVDLPGIATFVDGRRVSSADRWAGVTYRAIGIAS